MKTMAILLCSLFFPMSSSSQVVTDFHFPLSIGDEWHYMVTPHNGAPWEAYPDVHKAVKDTVMKNGKKYFAVTSRHRSPKYYRKEGLRVFEYLSVDSTEYLRFDFSKNAGDTVSVDPLLSHRTIVIQSITTSSSVIPGKRTFTFSGSPGGPVDDAVAVVSDSVGVTMMTAVGPQWDLVGAKLSGKTYGTILSAPQGGNALPETFVLSQNYPNPFNPSTTIEYRLPVRSTIRVEIFDMLGRTIATVAEGPHEFGVHTATWNASPYSSGIYLVRLTAGTFTDVKKITLIR